MAGISEAWIKQYIDQLIEVAVTLPEGPLKESCLLRVDHAMDLVVAWRQSREEQP